MVEISQTLEGVCLFFKIFLLPKLFFVVLIHIGLVAISCQAPMDFNKTLFFIKCLLSANRIVKQKNCFISLLPSFISFLFFSPLNVVFDSLPPAHYKETMNTILMWMQQSETKLSMPQVAIAEYEIMEQRLRELKVSDQAVVMIVSSEMFRRTELLSGYMNLLKPLDLE